MAFMNDLPEFKSTECYRMGLARLKIAQVFLSFSQSPAFSGTQIKNPYIFYLRDEEERAKAEIVRYKE